MELSTFQILILFELPPTHSSCLQSSTARRRSRRCKHPVQIIGMRSMACSRGACLLGTHIIHLMAAIWLTFSARVMMSTPAAARSRGPSAPGCCAKVTLHVSDG